MRRLEIQTKNKWTRNVISTLGPARSFLSATRCRIWPDGSAERLLEVRWRDENTRRYAARQLRCVCACANCVDERMARILEFETIPDNVEITYLELVTSLATTKKSLTTTPGQAPTSRGPTASPRRNPIRGACVICSTTSGNGWRMIMSRRLIRTGIFVTMRPDGRQRAH